MVTNVTLLGRTFSGDIDWHFTRDNFQINFANPPIGGSWKFSDGKVVLELLTSFPIQDDIGTQDTLFVSIFDNELSAITLAGSDILLKKTALAAVPPNVPGSLLCRFEAARPPRPFALIFPASLNDRRCCPASSRGKPLKRA